MALMERRQVADGEPGVVVGRADGAEEQDARVVEIVAEALGAGDLLDAVRARDAGADRMADGWRHGAASEPAAAPRTASRIAV